MNRKLVVRVVVSAVAAVSLAGTDVEAKTKHKAPLARTPAWSRESPEAKYPPNDPYAVWVAGTYVGRDPDPRVRDAMIREFYHNLNNR
jgi:hypothetical protein